MRERTGGKGSAKKRRCSNPFLFPALFVSVVYLLPIVWFRGCVRFATLASSVSIILSAVGGRGQFGETTATAATLAESDTSNTVSSVVAATFVREEGKKEDLRLGMIMPFPRVAVRAVSLSCRRRRRPLPGYCRAATATLTMATTTTAAAAAFLVIPVDRTSLRTRDCIVPFQPTTTSSDLAYFRRRETSTFFAKTMRSSDAGDGASLPSPPRRFTSSSSSTFSSSPLASLGNDLDGGDDGDDDDENEKAYAELSSLSALIRRHDALYYSSSGPEITDEEFDELCLREAEMCRSRPALLRRLQVETGLGQRATRFGGRVGPIVVDGDYDDNGNDNDDDDDDERGETLATTRGVEVGSIDPSSFDRFDGSVPFVNGDDRPASDLSMAQGDVRDLASSSPSTSYPSLSVRKKRMHLRGSPMLSLDNAMDSNDVVAWINRARKALLPSFPLLLRTYPHGAGPIDGDGGGSGDGYDETLEQRRRIPSNLTVNILAEPKMDGLSLSLRYRRVGGAVGGVKVGNDRTESGMEAEYTSMTRYELVWAATRGDGTRGEDVTDAIRAMDDTASTAATIPRSFYVLSPDSNSPSSSLSLSLTSRLDDEVEVRGEVVLPPLAFRRLRATSGYSNARNAASGILLRSSSSSKVGNVALAGGERESEREREEEEEEEEEVTRRLRSELRFYAYDVAPADSVLPFDYLAIGGGGGGGGDDGKIGGKERGAAVRAFLSGAGFAVPEPADTFAIALAEEKEVMLSDVADLMRYHERIMSSHSHSRSIGILPTGSSISSDGDDGTMEGEDVGEDGGGSSSMRRNDFDVDGAVYKFADARVRSALGSSARAPRWAVAHKFPPRTAVTAVRGVEVQVGRTGALTPVAVLDPVEIGGVTVSRATLHNFGHASGLLSTSTTTMMTTTTTKKKATTGPGFWSGTSVLVSRAGDVIPRVLRRVDAGGDAWGEDEDDNDNERAEWISLSPPKICPACGHDAVFEPMPRRGGAKRSAAVATAANDNDNDNDNDVTDRGADGADGAEAGQVLRCSGPQLLCPPRAVMALAHAFSRGGLDVRGLSEARLRQLSDAGLVRVPADVFRILDDDGRDNDDDDSSGMRANAGVVDDEGRFPSPAPQPPSVRDCIAELPGWGLKSAANLADAVRTVARDGLSLSRFVYSLGIRHVGVHTSELVAAAFGNDVNAFLDEVRRVGMTCAVAEDGGERAVSAKGHNGDEDDDGDGDGSLAPLPFSRLVVGDTAKGVGPVTIDALVAFAKEEALVDAARRLAEVVPIHSDLESRSPNGEDNTDALRLGSTISPPFEGMSVVFTGAIPGMTRASAQEAAKELGARSTPGSVSGSTDLVVLGEKGGKKAKEAAKYGVRVMDAEEFIRFLNEYRSSQ